MISPDSTDMLQLNDLISYSKSIEKKLGKTHYCSTAEDKEICDEHYSGKWEDERRGERGGEVDDILVVTK